MHAFAIVCSAIIAASPEAIDRSGRVVAPGGATFQLPPGMSYRAEVVDGVPAYLAADGRSAVGVSLALVEDPFTVDPALASAPGAEVFQTRRGHAALAVSLVAGGSEGAITIASVGNERVLVSIKAVSPQIGEARRLALAVAESVIFDARGGAAGRGLRRMEAPRPDPRLAGCYRRRWYDGMGFVDTLCLLADGRYRLEQRILMSSSAGVREAADESEGRWAMAGDQLLLDPERGAPQFQSVQVTPDGILLGDVGWERVAEEAD